MNKACLLLVVSLLFVGGSGGIAQGAYTEQAVQQLLVRVAKDAVSDTTLPGVSIAVMRQGDTKAVSAAFGVACLENATPMHVDSRFKIGSVTKVFTAALIHGLIDKGLLRGDTTIDRFFPAFPQGNSITVWNLLTHTSGIEDMLRLPAVYTNLTKPWSPQELIAMVAEQPLQFAPGTRQQYSNTGFLMLAEISEQVSGVPYAQQVDDLFVKRLGMQSLVVGNDTAVVPHLSCGYTGGGAEGVRLPLMASLGIAKGTGNLEAAPQDVVRLVNLYQASSSGFFDAVALQPLSFADGRVALVNDKSGTYSMGELDGCSLFVFTDPSITIDGKLGSFPGFGTAFLYDRQTRCGVVVSVNNETAMPVAVRLGVQTLHQLRDLVAK